MRNISTWLLSIFMVMFSGFRVILTITNQQGRPLEGIIIENIVLEIALIFLTLLCLILVIKRRLRGAIIYMISYWIYFGGEIFIILYNVLIKGQALQFEKSLELLISGIGVLLPFMVFLDTLRDKTRKVIPMDKKTDWFYKNKNFDRNFDKRADRNEYKIY